MITGKRVGVYIEGCANSCADRNTIIGGDIGVAMINSPGSQARDNIFILSDAADIIKEISNFLNEVESNSSKLFLSETSAEKLSSDVQAVRAQIKSQEPKGSIILTCMESIKNILENTAGSVIATSLLENAENIRNLLMK